MPETEKKGYLSEGFIEHITSMQKPHVRFTEEETGYRFDFGDEGYVFSETFEKANDDWMLHFFSYRLCHTKSLMKRHMMYLVIAEMQRYVNKIEFGE